jgi:uncharacterized protein
MTINNQSGRFIWHELLTTDVESAKGFYGELFGWKSRSVDMGPMKYTLLSAGDKDVGGLMQAQKGAPRWLTYAVVADVDAAVKVAKGEGASLELEAMTVPTVGRFAAVKHAAAGEIAPMAPETTAPELAGPPAVGTFCWDELVSQDPATATKFLSKVFGYTSEEKDMGPMGKYTVLSRGDKQAGGIMKAMQPQAPSAWLGYVLVADVAASHKKAQKLGATEIVPEISVPNVGRFTVVADKQGAMIGLLQGT